MNKVMIAALLTTMAIFVCGASAVSAQEVKAPAPVGVIVSGENFALLPALVKGETASANGALAQMNALKVQEAKTADGSALAELTGKTLFYLPTRTADILLTGETFRGKEVCVTGKLYRAENAVLVEKVEIKDVKIKEIKGVKQGSDEWDTIQPGRKSQMPEEEFSKEAPESGTKQEQANEWDNLNVGKKSQMPSEEFQKN